MLVERLNEINIRLNMIKDSYPELYSEIVDLQEERDELVELINKELTELKKLD